MNKDNPTPTRQKKKNSAYRFRLLLLFIVILLLTGSLIYSYFKPAPTEATDLTTLSALEAELSKEHVTLSAAETTTVAAPLPTTAPTLAPVVPVAPASVVPVLPIPPILTPLASGGTVAPVVVPMAAPAAPVPPPAAPLPPRRALDLEYAPSMERSESIFFMQTNLPDAISDEDFYNNPNVESPLLSEDFEEGDFEELAPAPVAAATVRNSRPLPAAQVPTASKAVLTAPTVVKAETVTTMTAVDLTDEKQLLSADPHSYTIQLIASGNKNAIMQLVSEHELQASAAIFRSSRQGKDWYTLIYGNYSSMQQAEQAIESLPLSLQDAKPWPRSMGSVQAIIRANG